MLSSLWIKIALVGVVLAIIAAAYFKIKATGALEERARNLAAELERQNEARRLRNSPIDVREWVLPRRDR